LNKQKVSKLIQLLGITIFVMSFSGCSVIEQIAEYNLERLYEEKEVVVDDTIYIPKSTYIKDSIEITMANPISLNPLDPVDYTIDQALKLIYQPIFKLSDSFELENGCISTYEKISEKAYRFTIDENASFHDDIPLTSEDIVYSFDYITKTIDSPYGYSIDYIEAITAISEKVFEVKFNTLDYYNLYALTFPIISKEYCTSDEYDPLRPIGSGPYEYSGFQTMIRLDLVRNPSFMGDAPLAPKITINIIREDDGDYNMFVAKRIDVHGPQITFWEDYSDDTKIQDFSYDSPYYFYLGFNHNNYFVKDIVGRQFIASVFPYDSIDEEVFLNHLSRTTLPLMPSHVLSKSMDPYYSEILPTSYYSRRYSKSMYPVYLKLLRQDIRYLVDYSPITLDLVYNTDDYYQSKIIEHLKQNFSLPQLKFNYVGLNAIDYKAALDLNDYDMFLGVIKTNIIPDFTTLYSTTGPLNIGGFSSINLNGLLSTYKKVNNKEHFIKQLENLSKVVTDELPIIPLGFLENGLFIHELIVPHAKPNFYNIYYGFENIEFSK